MLADIAKRLRAGLARSGLAEQALLIFTINLASKAVLVAANAYAARTLGPYKLGVSALVLTTVQQAALVFNGGFDVTAVRAIAYDKSRFWPVVSRVLTSRLVLSTITAIIWAVLCVYLIVGDQRMAWLVGPVLLVGLAANLNFAFQGIQHLPVLTTINGATSILCAAGYYMFLVPLSQVGSDLAIYTVATLLATGYSFVFLLRRVPRSKEAATAPTQPRMLKETWRYWLLAISMFFYSSFQITLISYWLDTASAGQYRAAMQLAGGVELLFNSLNSLLLARLTQHHKDGLQVMWREQLSLVKLAIPMGLLVVVPLVVGAGYIVHALLGPEYASGVAVFQFLVLSRLLVFVGQIYIFGLMAAHDDNFVLVSSLVVCVCNVVLTSLLLPRIGLVASAGVSVLTELSLFGAALFRTQHLLRNKRKSDPK